jgi:hypothetical protein
MTTAARARTIGWTFLRVAAPLAAGVARITSTQINSAADHGRWSHLDARINICRRKAAIMSFRRHGLKDRRKRG